MRRYLTGHLDPWPVLLDHLYLLVGNDLLSSLPGVSENV